MKPRGPAAYLRTVELRAAEAKPTLSPALVEAIRTAWEQSKLTKWNRKPMVSLPVECWEAILKEAQIAKETLPEPSYNREP